MLGFLFPAIFLLFNINHCQTSRRDQEAAREDEQIASDQMMKSLRDEIKKVEDKNDIIKAKILYLFYLSTLDKNKNQFGTDQPIEQTSDAASSDADVESLVNHLTEATQKKDWRQRAEIAALLTKPSNGGRNISRIQESVDEEGILLGPILARNSLKLNSLASRVWWTPLSRQNLTHYKMQHFFS